MSSTDTPYRTPVQKRSRESLKRLLESAEQQIRSDGLESLTIADVVRKAGLSVGAFYARFPDKTALLHAVQDRFHNRLEPPILEALRAQIHIHTTLAEAVTAATEILIRHVTSERELSRAFMMTSVFDPVMRARGELVNRDRRGAWAEVLLMHRAEIGHSDPVLAIDVAYGMYAAVVRGLLIFGQEHELYYGMDYLTLYEELTKALVRYLRGDRDPQAH